MFVDHGLLRENEAEEVLTLFRDHYKINLIYAREEDRFLTALDGVGDPETKRKIIGKLFIDVFEHHAGAFGRGDLSGRKARFIPMSLKACRFRVRPLRLSKATIMSAVCPNG